MFAPQSAPRNPADDLDPVYLAMASAMAGQEAQARQLKLAMADNPADRGKPMFEVGGGRGGGGSLFTRQAPNKAPANINTSQKEIKEALPEPLSRSERDWQNYGKRMKPDEVLDSEVVWGRAQLYQDKGLSAEEGFAAAANDFWGRMGANRFITPEQAKKYMHKSKANLRSVD